MAGIIFRFLRKGIASNYPLQLGLGSDEIVGCHFQPFFRFSFEQTFNLGIASSIVVEDNIAALQQSADVGELQSPEKVLQIRHRDLISAANINSTEKGAMGWHEDARRVRKKQKGRSCRPC